MLPKIVSLGRITIFAYPLFMGLAWGIGYNLSLRIMARNGLSAHFNQLFWGVFLSAWVGAKALFLITSQGIASSSSFWLGGGFVFYGGLLGGLAFVVLYCRLSGRYRFSDLYRLLPAVAIGHGVGRIGCFLAGCCYGIQTDSFIGVLLHGVTQHPVQLYESLLLIALGIFLYKNLNKGARFSLTVYLVSYAVGRFILEFLRGDIIRGHVGIFSTAQIISLIILLVILSEALWLRFIRRKVTTEPHR